MCDTAVVVGEKGVLFAKNSDRDPNEAQILDYRPRRESAPGAEVRCTWIAIPDVRRTHAVLLSRPYWMWGAEIGANEHGVVIGNEAVFTHQRLPRRGLTGMDLLRLALERAETAEEAVTVITDLVARHGQGGPCGHESGRFSYSSSFLVADRRGAFVLETAGHEHAVERIERGARSISNGLTIHGFDKEHGDALRTFASRCRVRRARTERAARAATSPRDMFALLRDHGEDGFIHYDALFGGMAAPCMHAGGLVASAQTVASWVSEIGPDGARHWVTATAAPCTSLFKPIRLGDAVEMGRAPTAVADASALFWRHERLHRAAMRDPERLFPLFVPERDEVEARWLESPPNAADAFREADALLAKWTQRVRRAGGGTSTRPAHAERYWRTRDAWAGLAPRLLGTRGFRKAWASP